MSDNNEIEMTEVRKMAESIHAQIVKTDANLSNIPFTSEAETLRLVLTQLSEQLHRMERNLQDLLEMDLNENAAFSANNVAGTSGGEEE